MATANLTLPDGSKVAIEGTAEEVAMLISQLSSAEQPEPTKGRRRRKTSARLSGHKEARATIGPRQLIEELARDDYFKAQKRTIGDVQKKLEENGHIYALHSLSPVLLRLTRAKVLRRIKEKKVWVYVK